MITLSESVRDAFAQRLIDRQRATFPAAVSSLPARGHREIVAAGINRALCHGFDLQIDVALYVGLFFVIGPGFDDPSTSPGIARLLTCRTLAPAERLNWIYFCAQLEPQPRAGSR